jgi:hypothetical protein
VILRMWVQWLHAGSDTLAGVGVLSEVDPHRLGEPRVAFGGHVVREVEVHTEGESNAAPAPRVHRATGRYGVPYRTFAARDNAAVRQHIHACYTSVATAFHTCKQTEAPPVHADTCDHSPESTKEE